MVLLALFGQKLVIVAQAYKLYKRLLLLVDIILECSRQLIQLFSKKRGDLLEFIIRVILRNLFWKWLIETLCLRIVEVWHRNLIKGRGLRLVEVFLALESLLHVLLPIECTKHGTWHGLIRLKMARTIVSPA